MQLTHAAPSRLVVLIQTNIRWLKQALQLVGRLDAATYAESRAGAHLRHVLEFYECFLDGMDSSHIDYDARRRDETVESRPQAAEAKIRAIIRRLETDPLIRQERIVWVRMEDAETGGVRDVFMESSLSRELQMLGSHTVHHYALVAMVLRPYGVEMAPEFGMAPSTLRYLAAKTAEAA